MRSIFARRRAATLGSLLSGTLAAFLAMSPPALAQSANDSANGSGPARIGGGCEYVEIPGVATITGIAKTAESEQQATVSGGPGYEGMEIRYTFAPSAPVADPHVKAWADETHTLQLANSWYPGPRYVEKYGLAEGKTLSAVLKVRTKGTCSPYVMDFPDLDLTDYFETASLRAFPLYSTG